MAAEWKMNVKDWARELKEKIGKGLVLFSVIVLVVNETYRPPEPPTPNPPAM